MKKKGLAYKALSLAVSVCVITAIAVSSSAHIAIVEDKSSMLTSDIKTWQISVDRSNNGAIGNLGFVTFDVKLDGDTEKYEREKDAQAYEDNENTWVDFTGQIGVGLKDWFGFGFSTLSQADGDSSNSKVEKTGDNEYRFTADLRDKDTSNDEFLNATIKLEEWGNRSDDYYLSVKNMTLYDVGGAVIISFDEKGSETAGTALDLGGGEAAQTTEAPSGDETGAAEEASASDGAAVSQQSTPAAASSQDDLESRDASLIIVLIVAGVLIVAVVVVLIILSARKKR